MPIPTRKERYASAVRCGARIAYLRKMRKLARNPFPVMLRQMGYSSSMSSCMLGPRPLSWIASPISLEIFMNSNYLGNSRLSFEAEDLVVLLI